MKYHFERVKTVMLNTKPFHMKINKFSYEINNLKNTIKNGRTMYAHYPCQIISKKNSHMKWHSPVIHQEIVYPVTYFHMKKRKMTSRKFSEMSFEKVNRNVKKKHFIWNQHLSYENQQLKNTSKMGILCTPITSPLQNVPQKKFCMKMTFTPHLSLLRTFGQ